MSDDEYDFGEVSKPKAKAKAKAKVKTSTSSPAASPVAKKSKKAPASASEEYQRLDLREHILKRPDTYVGSIEKTTEKLWVYDEEVGLNYRSVTFVPGLYKIFDEVLVNAADNKQRDPKMDTIKVVINPKKGEISVYNNGRGIPVEIHAKEKLYIPELIFGVLLTGANYDDEYKKTVGGRNGYGAKLANIFSKEFKVETVDKRLKKKFTQVWKENMTIKGNYDIESSDPGEQWTRITFKPDLKWFGMDCLDEDIVALLSKRVLDVAGCNPKVKVSLNGKAVTVASFSEYIQLYFKNSEQTPIVARINERWEVGVALSKSDNFQQVSFVNSINTVKGGTHVNYVADKIVKYVSTLVTKKNKNVPIKAPVIKNHLWIFVNSLIENPAFDSQTKETLVTKPTAFGSTCDFEEPFLKKVAKTGIVELALQMAQFKQGQAMKRETGKKKGRLNIEKLDDANFAGKKGSGDCTLILTEGDSAKALAVSGLGVIGRDYYGVFPLRGKPLNVREESLKKVQDNAELANLTRILGLQHMKKYESLKDLRYGHLMIMTDQDHDGSHIKGLLINFIHCFWPDLLQIPGFLMEFVTPIVKAKKGTQEIAFFTLTEYNEWKLKTQNGKGWNIKYYKGLGTSTAAEAKNYFANIDRHKIEFMWEGEEDGQAIDLAFSKKRADDRKTWIGSYDTTTFVDHSQSELTYTDFINKELVQFSLADNVRSIPSMVDGLKPGQRKILFCCFKRNLKSDMKVAQLSGYVSEHSAYHHGEASLHSTIVNMAQNFVGANNINTLFPSGQFGTRLAGGKDSASPRYIFTRLSELTRFIYRSEDDDLLEYLDDDGDSIEPRWYCPIIPMVLVNGSEGIGTGWSTFTPNYDPREIAENLKRLLNDEEPELLTPWFKGFQGTIIREKTLADGEQYSVTGKWEKVDSTTLRITELPVGVWTNSYKQFLESIVIGGVVAEKKAEGKKEKRGEKKTEGKKERKSAEPFLSDYREHHTDTTVDFSLEFTEENMKMLESEGVEKKLKLSTKLSTTNIHLFDAQGRIKKYTPTRVLHEFYDLRLQYYEKRKQHLIQKRTQELEKLSNRVRFILMVINGELIVNNRKKADLMRELSQKGFKVFPKESTKKGNKSSSEGKNEDEPEEEKEDEKNYNYLLSMALWSLTKEKVEQLRKECKEKEAEVQRLVSTRVKDMWTTDLDQFLLKLDEVEQKEREEAAQEPKKKAGRGRAPAKRKAPVKRKAGFSSDEEDDFKPSKKKISTTPTKKPISSASSTTSASLKPVLKVESITKPIPAAKPKSAKPTSPKKPIANSSSGATSINAYFKPVAMEKDADDIPLMERLAARKGTGGGSVKNDDFFSSSTAKPKAKVKGTTAGKPASKAIDLDEEDEDGFEFKPPSKSKAKTTAITASKAKASRKVLDSDEDEDVSPKKTPAKAIRKRVNDEEEELSDSSPPKTKSKAKAKAKAKAKTSSSAGSTPKKKAKKRSIDSEDEMDIEEEDDDFSDSISPTKGGGGRTARDRKQVNYKMDSDDDSDVSEFELSD